MIRSQDPPPSLRTLRRGYTLVVVVVVSTIIGIPAPMFMRTIEQSKLDMAAAYFRAIWCAERYYHLEYDCYVSLPELQDSGLLAPSTGSGKTSYLYRIDPIDTQYGWTFTATATPNPMLHSPCTGSRAIDQTGSLTCLVYYGKSSDVKMVPSLEPSLGPGP